MLTFGGRPPSSGTDGSSIQFTLRLAHKATVSMRAGGKWGRSKYKLEARQFQDGITGQLGGRCIRCQTLEAVHPDRLRRVVEQLKGAVWAQEKGGILGRGVEWRLHSGQVQVQSVHGVNITAGSSCLEATSLADAERAGD